MIPALVLTAGLATRLRPLSLVRAKAAFPVGKKPLISRILQSLAVAGVTDAVLNLHHLPHTLTRIVGDGSEFGIKVRYSWEVPVLGSAGGPWRAIPLIGSPTFLIINGDTLSTMDLAALVEHHQRSGALVTMGVVPNTEPEKYGGVLVDDHGIVTGFVKRGASQRSHHFTFAQVVEAAAFDGVPADTPFETVGALYPAIIAAKPGAVQAFRSKAEYDDIRAPGDYLSTALAYAARDGIDMTIGHGTRIDRSARIEQSVLWDDVEVEPDVMLRECVVADGARVPADTSWHGVSLRPATDELAPGEKRIGDLAIASL